MKNKLISYNRMSLISKSMSRVRYTFFEDKFPAPEHMESQKWQKVIKNSIKVSHISQQFIEVCITGSMTNHAVTVTFVC